jgi:4'-phosphopantetheinyl transferase
VTAGRPPRVDAWWVRLDQCPLTTAALATLSPREHRRWRELSGTPAARRFAVGRVALRHLLAADGGQPASEQRLRAFLTPTGERARGPVARWSSSGDALVVLVCDDVDTGVDLESPRPTRRDGPPPVELLHPTERAEVEPVTDPAGRWAVFLRFWVRRQSVIKAAGVGILASTSFPVLAVGPGCHRADLPDGRRFDVRDLPVPAPFVAALATTGSSPQVRWHPFEWPHPDDDTGP